MTIKLEMSLVKHKKTGNYYYKINNEVIDCTNSRDGTPAVVYYREGKLFVREKQEFEEKFEPVSNAM